MTITNKYLKRRITLIIIIAIGVTIFVLPILNFLIGKIFGFSFNSEMSDVLFLLSIIFYFIKDDKFIGRYFKKEDNLEIEIINRKHYLKRLIIAIPIAICFNMLIPFVGNLVNFGGYLISFLLEILCLVSIIFYFIDDSNVSTLNSEGQDNFETTNNKTEPLKLLGKVIPIAFLVSGIYFLTASFLITGMFAELFNFYVAIGLFFGTIIFYFLYIFFRLIQKLPWLFCFIAVYVSFMVIAKFWL